MQERMKHEKLFHWKQKTPFDQLTTIRGALDGHLSNLEEGVTTESYTKHTKRLLQELEALEYFLKYPEMW